MKTKDLIQLGVPVGEPIALARRRLTTAAAGREPIRPSLRLLLTAAAWQR